MTGTDIKPGMHIIMTKYAGLAGTIKLADENRQRLAERFNRIFLAETEALSKLISTQTEKQIAGESGSAVYPVGEYGVYPALWRIWTESGFGFTIDLGDIPFRQHTVEICDFLGMNPFAIDGGGSLLIVTGEPIELMGSFVNAGIPSRIVGRITANKDKKLFRGETVGYLNRPETYSESIWERKSEGEGRDIKPY